MSADPGREQGQVTPDAAAGTPVQEPAPHAAAPDGAGPDTASAPEPDPQEQGSAPLASLSSLLGGSIEGGSGCSVDGTCD